MSWKAHTEILSNNISKYCCIMTRLKKYLPLYISRMLYFSMLNLHPNYGFLVWGYECKRLIKNTKAWHSHYHRKQIKRSRKTTCIMKPGPCLIVVTWRSFLWKLRCHWMKGLRQRRVAVVRRGQWLNYHLYWDPRGALFSTWYPCRRILLSVGCCQWGYYNLSGYRVRTRCCLWLVSLWW